MDKVISHYVFNFILSPQYARHFFVVAVIALFFFFIELLNIRPGQSRVLVQVHQCTSPSRVTSPGLEYYQVLVMVAATFLPIKAVNTCLLLFKMINMRTCISSSLCPVGEVSLSVRRHSLVFLTLT